MTTRQRTTSICGLLILMLVVIGVIISLRDQERKPLKRSALTEQQVQRTDTSKDPMLTDVSLIEHVIAEVQNSQDEYLSQLDLDTQKRYRGLSPEWSKKEISMALENLKEWGDPLSPEWGMHLKNFIAEKEKAIADYRRFGEEMDTFGKLATRDLEQKQEALARLKQWLKQNEPLITDERYVNEAPDRDDPSHRNLLMEGRGNRFSQTPQKDLASEKDEPKLQTWQEHLKREVSDLKLEIRKKYPGAFAIPYLTQEELGHLYPTESDRMALENQKQQMQNAITLHVQNVLSEDTPGNRAEKLDLIRDTLSEDWDADFAEAVIRQLQQEK